MGKPKNIETNINQVNTPLPFNESPMIRISLEWTDRMLMVGAAACNIKIEKLNPLTSSVSETLFEARGKVERYSHGYSNCKWGGGLTGEIFDKEIKPYLDAMMLSYRRGMCLEESDFHWIRDWRFDAD